MEPIEILLNRIDGFLIAVNIYLEKKCEKSPFVDMFFFDKKATVSHLLDERIKEATIFDVDDYENQLRDFISSGMYDDKFPENHLKYAETLFKLIDAIFNTKITSIQRIETYDQDCFVIEYENSFYIFQKCWWA